jgi:hypothetical protein
MPAPDNFAYLVPVEYELHTPEAPFCYDQTCPCHEDQDDMSLVVQYVDTGLLTPQEATDFVGGHTV